LGKFALAEQRQCFGWIRHDWNFSRVV
jgi:hypothetical protein